MIDRSRDVTEFASAAAERRGLVLDNNGVNFGQVISELDD